MFFRSYCCYSIIEIEFYMFTFTSISSHCFVTRILSFQQLLRLKDRTLLVCVCVCVCVFCILVIPLLKLKVKLSRLSVVSLNCFLTFTLSVYIAFTDTVVSNNRHFPAPGRNCYNIGKLIL
jgi:hypothetical protein